jgi:hypothetical protein
VSLQLHQTSRGLSLSSPLFFHSALLPHSTAQQAHVIGFRSAWGRDPGRRRSTHRPPRDLVAAGAALRGSPRLSGVSGAVGSGGGGERAVSAIHQIRRRRRRRHRRRRHGPQRAARLRALPALPTPLQVRKPGKISHFRAVPLLWTKGGCLLACAGASWWCRAAGGRRRSRRGR